MLTMYVFSHFVLFYFLLFIILVNYRTRYKCHISINVNSFHRVDKKSSATNASSIHINISGTLCNNQKIEGRWFIYIINWPLLWYCHMSSNIVNAHFTFFCIFYIDPSSTLTLCHIFLNTIFLMQFHNKTSKFWWFVPMD